jgi:type III restriction enzyme
MKFKFDANQDYQKTAVDSVADIFEGQEKSASNQAVADNSLLGIYPNSLSLSQEEVFDNVKKIQERNKISGNAADSFDFSVEMETGTGKTYVYLRTIFELHKRYGWKKFIVLVPSVAIREGVIKTLQITKEHFADLYDGTPYRFYEYQSKNISQVRHFATSSNIEIMVMTVGAFNRDTNVLYGERDQMHGEEPITYIQKTNPILILDEPQNMEGDATREGLTKFNSLFRLRYSATHKNAYNLMYQLAPYDAYQLGLVKKIEVYSVVDSDAEVGSAYVTLLETSSLRSTIKAKIEVYVKDADGITKKKKIVVKQGDDLEAKTNNPIYAGYVIEDMSVEAPDFGAVGKIKFRNGVEVLQGQGVNDNKHELMREQIVQTIKLHFEKKKKLKEFGIKALSLFFIDKVDNYVQEEGFIRKAFLEEVARLKNEYGEKGLDVNASHKGYFAKRGEDYLERETSIAENQEAYELIMKDKERLLSFDEPTEFIFSHSALKEGWDNPNIFNICTLREGASVIRKRQEIGRGMRLCVNQDGERVSARNVNLLSVIANESYSEYVATLQSEFEEDGIYKGPPLPSNAKKRTTVKLKKDFAKNENFQQLWDRISKKTRFVVSVNTEALIEESAKKIAALAIKKPQIRIERAGINLEKKGVTSRLLGDQSDSLTTLRREVDCVRLIEDDTKLTRATVIEILKKAKNTKSITNNPEKFCYEAVKIIKNELLKQYVSQVIYEVVPEKYSVDEFEDIPSYKDSTEKVRNSIYEAIVFDSNVEKDFAIELDHDERIKLFIKMPGWFKVATPVGNYNPDWAIVTVRKDLQGKESKEKFYFVIETKGDVDNLRESEQAKINSAKKHFEVIEVNYKEVESFNQFAEQSLRN